MKKINKAKVPLPPDWKGNADGTSKIVAASAAMTGHGELGSGDRTRAKDLEQVMARAVTDCLADGISMDNADEIRARMLQYREEYLVGKRTVSS